MRSVLEVIGVAIVAGLIYTGYDGAMVGELRWENLKLFVYSMALGAIGFLLPYAALLAIAFLIKLFAKHKWSPHRFAIIAATIIAARLLWGGYYGSMHVPMPQV